MWGNCTDNMKAKIKFSTKYQNMNDDKNGINLLNDPEQVTLKYEDQHYPHESYMNMQQKVYNVAQGNLENTNYYNFLQIMLRQLKVMDPK